MQRLLIEIELYNHFVLCFIILHKENVLSEQWFWSYVENLFLLHCLLIALIVYSSKGLSQNTLCYAKITIAEMGHWHATIK